MKRFLIGGFLLLGVCAVAYLATLGCCQLVSMEKKPIPLSRMLDLTYQQRQEVAPLEKRFLAQKESSCAILCAKRAQMIQLLKGPEPDRSTLNVLTQEIGQEQTALEKATLEHMLALRQFLTPAQQQRLASLVEEQLRTACRLTACGVTPGCTISESQRKQAKSS